VSMNQLTERVRKGRSPKDPYVLQDIAINAPQFIAHLKAHDTALEGWTHLEPDWIADIYQAVATGLGYESTDNEHACADPTLFMADQADRAAVGAAFEQVLVPALPHGVEHLVAELALRTGATKRPSRGQSPESLEQEPDVLAGGKAARDLARVGIAPVDIVLASDGLAMLLDRACDAGACVREAPVFLRRRGAQVLCIDQVGAELGLARSELVEEIRSMTDLDDVRAAVLLDWLAQAAGSIPALFVGYASRFDHHDICLVANEHGGDAATANLFRRWQPATGTATAA